MSSWTAVGREFKYIDCNANILQVVLFFTIYRYEPVLPVSAFQRWFLTFCPILFNWALGKFSIQGHKGLTTESASPGSGAWAQRSSWPCFSSWMLSVIQTESTTLSLKFRWHLQDFSFERVSLSQFTVALEIQPCLVLFISIKWKQNGVCRVFF